MEVSDADRLLARGAPITLRGEAFRVRFGFESLLYLEKEYGGLDVFWAALGESGFGMKRVDTIFTGMVAGLLHTRLEGQDIDEFKAELLTSLEPKDLLQYLEAVIVAFGESIPSFESGPAPKAKGSRGNSHGRGSTSTRQSATVAPNGSSGG